MAIPTFDRDGYLSTGRAIAPALALIASAFIASLEWVQEVSLLHGLAVTLACAIGAYVLGYLLWPCVLVCLVWGAVNLLLHIWR